MAGKRRNNRSSSGSNTAAASTTPKSSSKRRKKQHNETSSFPADDITPSTSKEIPSSSSVKSFNHDEIVSYITKFLSATKSSSSEKESFDFPSVISYLIRFLQKNTTTAVVDDEHAKDQQQQQQQQYLAGMYITKEDVATLLLPWSVSRLMRLAAAASTNNGNTTNTGDELDAAAWAAISSSLDIIDTATNLTADTSKSSQVLSSSNETLLSSCFPQSTLNRLVPYAGRIAFSSAQHSSMHTHSIQESASNTFVHLVQRYKSSFDVVCKTLLSDIDSLVSNHNNDKTTNETTTTTRLPQEVAVVRATLQKIHELMENANPKRLFTIVCSTDVLPKLGRLSMVISSAASEEDANDGENLIQKILWDGLFHPVHHMDGFRTMGEMKTVPKVDVVDVEAVAGKQKEDKKGSNKTCFQAGLFHSVRMLLSSTDAGTEEDVIAAAKLLPTIVHGFFERVREHAMRSKNGGSTTEADAKLQFRFWCHLILPLLETLFNRKQWNGNEDVNVALLDTISQTLGLVLQYDAYLPSYNDPDEEHLTYLQSVANGLEIGRASCRERV